jgi:hypothetical protein
VQGFAIENGAVTAVILGSGERIACSRVIYADRWSALPGMQGMPKPLSFLRRLDPMAALQVAFRHEPAVGAGLLEGFFGPIQREAGEDEQRHIWGSFSSDGSRSLWTVVLGANQVEDNHEIAKKLRRMKQALDKMFTGESWLPAGQADFLSTVKEEQVRFEESVLFAGGEAPSEPVRLPKLSGIEFLTDGYGPGAALEQVASALAIELTSEPETETPALREGRIPSEYA